MALAHLTLKTRAGQASLIRLHALRGERHYLYALTPVGDSDRAYRQRFRITKISNLAVLEGLAKRIRHGSARFSLKYQGKTIDVVAQSKDRTGMIQLLLESGDMLIFSPDDGVTQTPQAMTELVALGAMLAILATVAIVGAVAIELTSDDGGSSVEGEAGGREEGGEGGGDSGGNGGDTAGGGGEGN